MNWLTYAVPRERLLHYVVLALIVMYVGPYLLLNRDPKFIELVNNYLIFDLLYYLFFIKLRLTDEE